MTLLLAATVSLSAKAQYCTEGTCVSGDYYVEDTLGLNMILMYVPEGDFLMGSEKGESDESHLHYVVFDEFFMSATEVTQAQWEAVMGTNVYQQAELAGTTCQTEAIGDDYPMCYVSWEDAMTFCRELSRITGHTYTLPTEAQWEYAARYGGDSDMRYSGSYNINAVATYDYNSSGCTEVASRLPNSLGIYDMCGNVWEWCYDWYDDNYYSYSDSYNPDGACNGTYRVHRGGAYNNSRSVCTVTNRGASLPEKSAPTIGFRVVLLDSPQELMPREEVASFESLIVDLELAIALDCYEEAAEILFESDIDVMYEALFGENSTEENEERVVNVISAIIESEDEEAIELTLLWLAFMESYVEEVESLEYL